MTEVPAPAPKTRRASRALLVLAFLFLGLLAALVHWADGIATTLARPILAGVGVPAGRVALAGFSIKGTRIYFFADASVADPFLSITIPFVDLRNVSYTLPKVEVWVDRLPKPPSSSEAVGQKESGEPPGWEAALKNPLSLEWLPWREVKLTQWIVHLGTLQFTGAAALNLEGAGAYRFSVVTDSMKAAFGPIALDDALISVNGEAGREKPVLKADLTSVLGGKVANLPLGTFNVSAEYPGARNLPLKISGAGGFLGHFTLEGGLDPATQEADLDFEIKDGALSRESLKVEGIAAKAHITQLLKLTGTVSAQKIEAGIALTEAKAAFNIEGSSLRISSAGANLLGGAVSLEPATLRLPMGAINLTVNAEALDLVEVLKLANVTGLAGTGKLSGAIPFTLAAPDLTVKGATLKTTGPGTIAYQPAEKPGFMAEGGQGALLGQVFSDFRYQAITVSLDGTIGKDLKLSARIEGMNPEFYAGHPVAFNLNLTGALDSVLRQGLATTNLTQGGLSDLVKMEKKQ